MRLLLILLIAVSVNAASPPESTLERGTLVVVGGALAPDNHAVYNEIIRRSGGAAACRVVIIAAASATPSATGQSYRKDFIRYGVASERVTLLPLALLDDPETPDVDESAWTDHANDPKLATELDKATAAFLAGGDQSRYTRLLLTPRGTDGPLLRALRRLLGRGGVIAGSSAGAAVMSDPMITGGNSLDTLAPGPAKKDYAPLTMARGLGFWDGGLVDQHFLRRGRWGRLVAALLRGSRHRLAVGVGENTAAVIHAGRLTVVGTGRVVVFDRRPARLISPDPLHCTDLVFQVLAAGDTMDLKRGTVKPAVGLMAMNLAAWTSRDVSPTPMAGAFDPHGLTRILWERMIRPRCRGSRALAWDARSPGVHPGVSVRIRFTRNTRVYLTDKQQGPGRFTVMKACMDIQPVIVSVRPR